MTLEKALHRLGAADAADCQISLDYFHGGESAFRDLCVRTLETEGIFALNHWCEAVCNHVKPENHMAFVAAFTASGMDSTLDAVKVAENIDSFYYAKGVKNEADLGRWWLEHYSQFTISPELQQFFDYKSYGEYLSQFLDVHYLESGDCIFLDGTAMDEVLGIAPDEEMGMGGIRRTNSHPPRLAKKPIGWRLGGRKNKGLPTCSTRPENTHPRPLLFTPLTVSSMKCGSLCVCGTAHIVPPRLRCTRTSSK